MRALEKLNWQGLRAEQSHLKDNDKVANWENQWAMRIDEDDAIAPAGYIESIKFLMKQAKRSLKRLELYKCLRVQCSMIHDDCRQALDQQKLTRKRHKKLESNMKEAAENMGFMEYRIGDETEWFKHVDEYLSDVMEDFTNMFARDQLSKDVDFEHPKDLDSGEFAPRPISLTKH